jgi:serine/threonine protein kinase
MLHDVPTVLGGRYRIVERLGRGGMADVYRADDVVLRRPVAIKVFRGGVEREAHLARFRAEVRTLAALTHPHLVALYDAGGDVVEPWCAMEYVNGGSLADRDESVPAEAVARIGEQIASALVYVHGKSIVHRDVKPSNVLLDRGGDAFLSDFGIAKIVDGTRMTQSGLMIGTAAFLSPEQVRGRTAGPPADVYALGLVLLEALTGHREYPGGPVESAVARLSRSPEIPESLGSVWGDLLRGMTSESAADRPGPEDVRTALRGIARHLAGLDSLTLDLVGEATSGEGTTAGEGATAGDDTTSGEGATAGDDSETDETTAETDETTTETACGDVPSRDARPHGAVLLVPEAGPTALPRPLPLVAIEMATRDTDGSTPDHDRTPVVVTTVAPPVTSPRNLLGWLTPERRRRAHVLISAAGIMALVTLALPLIDGFRSVGNPLRIDSASGSSEGASLPSSPSASAGIAEIEAEEGQSLRRAPIGVLLPPLPTYDPPAPRETTRSARRWPRGNRRVSGTAATRTVSKRVVKTTPSVSPKPSPSPSPKPSPSPSPSPSPTGTPTQTASGTPATTSTTSTSDTGDSDTTTSSKTPDMSGSATTPSSPMAQGAASGVPAGVSVSLPLDGLAPTGDTAESDDATASG